MSANEQDGRGMGAKLDERRYTVEYLDSRGRWHRRRGSYDLATVAIEAARDIGQRCDVYGWRIADGAGNVVTDSVAYRKGSARA